MREENGAKNLRHRKTPDCKLACEHTVLLCLVFDEPAWHYGKSDFHNALPWFLARVSSRILPVQVFRDSMLWHGMESVIQDSKTKFVGNFYDLALFWHAKFLTFGWWNAANFVVSKLQCLFQNLNFGFG
jgi:hypothetical protein